MLSAIAGGGWLAFVAVVRLGVLGFVAKSLSGI